jgi:type IV pilus assembly protein PilN
MILINLLPHREAARKRRREQFFSVLAASVLMGALVAGAIYLWLGAQISDQRQTNDYLQSEITKLESEIKEISTLQSEIAGLKARQQAVENLQGDRNLPVHLLNELVSQLPDGVYLSSMKQDDRVVTLQGTAQSNERVSELLRNLGTVSPWLTKPELVEITAGSVSLTPRDQRRVANFTMRIGLRRPTDADKPAAAAPAVVVPTPRG